jgi:hypothetical protein
MLEVIAQHHQVMDNAEFRIFGFPEKHLVKVILACLPRFPH